MSLENFSDSWTKSLLSNRDIYQSIQIPEIKPVGEVQFDAIKEQIQRFEESIDQTMEVAVRLASFGSNITMSVDSIEWDGVVIVFHGWVSENRATLVQNMSQLNFLLLAVPRAAPEEPRKKIGFSASSD